MTSKQYRRHLAQRRTLVKRQVIVVIPRRDLEPGTYLATLFIFGSVDRSQRERRGAYKRW
jgi:hypothetical protein